VVSWQGETFWELVERAMRANNRSEKDLIAVGVSKSTISKLKSGRRLGRDPETLVLLTRALAPSGEETALLEALLQAAGFSLPWVSSGRGALRVRNREKRESTQIFDPRSPAFGERENFYVLVQDLPNVSQTRFEKQIAAEPQVLSAFEVLGQVDAVLKIVARNSIEAQDVVERVCRGVTTTHQILSSRRVYWDWTVLRSDRPILGPITVEGWLPNAAEPRLAWLQIGTNGSTQAADVKAAFEAIRGIEDLASVIGGSGIDLLLLVRYESLTALRGFIQGLLKPNSGDRGLVRTTITMLVVSVLKYQPRALSSLRQD